MGAATFFTTAAGKSAKDAFNKAIEQALHEHGHAGYTGSIAEKMEFVKIAFTPGPLDPYDIAQNLIDDDDPRISDKWGPAGCMELRKPTENADGVFLFFGWARE